MEHSQISSYFDILGRSQRAYSKFLEPICKARELTRSELDVLLFLYNNPDLNRAADIVTYRGMAKSHVSLSVTNLTDRGLLRRCFSDTDRRTVHLALTEEGAAIAAEGRQAQQEFFQLLHRGVTEEEKRQWDAVYRKISANILALDP